MEILSIENSWAFVGLEKVILQDSLENTAFLMYKEIQENLKANSRPGDG